MKLTLILLAALLNFARGGFMAELTGSLSADVPCTGDEYADFKQCLPDNVGDEEEEALFSPGGVRALQSVSMCSGCSGGTPYGTFCFTFCGGRRRLEEGTNLRKLQSYGSAAECNDGACTVTLGDAEENLALGYAEEIIECLANVAATHLCLGDTNDMTLVVHA